MSEIDNHNENGRRTEGDATAVDESAGVSNHASKDNAASSESREPSSDRKVDWALDAAAMGYKVFPWRSIARNGKQLKLPCIKKWEERATSDPDGIRRMWQRFPGANIAAAVGRSEITALDIDVKGGKRGDTSLRALEAIEGDLPKKRRVGTPTKGEHIHMLGVTGSNAGRLGDGLDVRGMGGWVAMPGSTTAAGIYRWIEREGIEPAPGWFITLAGTPRERDASAGTEPATGWDNPADIERAKHFLSHDAQPAVEGSGGDARTFGVACSLRDMGLCEETAFELMLGLYNPRCVPPWSGDELATKVSNAYRYAKGAAGDSSVTSGFEDDPETAGCGAGANPTDALVRRLNDRFCAVLHGGAFSVFMEDVDHSFDPPRKVWAKMSREAFRHYHENKSVRLPDARKETSLGDLWLKHPERREYPGIVFDPKGGNAGGKLNLWRGWAVEPSPGDWSMLRWLINRVLCGECQASGEYVTKWIAFMLQRPWESPEVAIAFRGGKGTGKGTLGRALMRLAGPHGMIVASPAQFAGRFNAHLRDCVFLFADEAFWPGDKSAEGVLKQLVTEPVISYEGKGVDIAPGRNLVHLMMASNEGWVIPATVDERRFAIFDVTRERQNDRAFFERLWAQLDDGGLAAMAHDLMSLDLDGWHPSQDVPRTEALADQKIMGLPAALKWWHELLTRGTLPLLGETARWKNGPVTLGESARAEMVDDFDRYLKRNRVLSEKATHKAITAAGKQLGLETDRRTPAAGRSASGSSPASATCATGSSAWSAPTACSTEPL
jgi:hypothetical protein